MLAEHDGKQPFVAESAVIAPTALISGDVHIGAGTVVLAGAVVTAISGATIADGVFIATGASVFNGAVLESDTVVTINAVVHIGTVCPAGTLVPIGHIAFGDPARIASPSEAPSIHRELAALGFTKAVFGFEAKSLADPSTIGELCLRYSKALSRHRDDRIIEPIA